MSVMIGKDGKSYSLTGLGYSLAYLPAVSITDVVYKIYGVPVFRTGGRAIGRAKSQENTAHSTHIRSPRAHILYISVVLGFRLFAFYT